MVLSDGFIPGEDYLSDEFVDVKCNKCGNEISFCPSRVMLLRGCPCGNDDYGRASTDWQEYKFGNFTFIQAYRLKMPGLNSILGRAK